MVCEVCLHKAATKKKKKKCKQDKHKTPRTRIKPEQRQTQTDSGPHKDLSGGTLAALSC